jgi:hypothetical protein
MQHETLETVAQTASKVTYVSSGGAILFGLTANEIAAFGGLIIGVLTWLVNFYYRRKSDRREAKLYELKGVIDREE